MARGQCWQRYSIYGLEVITCSGTAPYQSECRLRPDLDIRHILYLENNNVYRVELDCEANIISSPQTILFNSPYAGSPGSTDTIDRWQRDFSLDDGQEVEFRDIALDARPGSRDPSTIKVVVASEWKDAGLNHIADPRLVVYPQ